MNVLFVSNDLIGGNLAYLLKKEGHSVKLYINERARRNNFENLVMKTNNWKSELKWVGKKGLIIFDDVGYGKEQDKLRAEGYTVFGGSEIADRLEQDRTFGQIIFNKYGLKTANLIDFNSFESAINFVEKHKGSWVIKQNDHHYSKVINYVGQFEDGRDVIDVLKNYQKNPKTKNKKISLHQKLVGVEIGVGRYFNGHEWVGPIEFNIEYPRFFPGDIGPMTSEMGTLAWYSNDENNRLYREVLLKLKPFLVGANFRGDFEVNCIVNENGVYPLEATSRIGSPIIHLHTELHNSPWGEFLLAVAKGNSYQLQWKKGYGIVVLAAVPPFPYGEAGSDSLVRGTQIYFDNCSNQDMKHVHFEEVSKNGKSYFISDSRGYILYVTATAKEIPNAQKNAYRILNKIKISKLFYRNDIGSSFIENEMKLKKWGYL